MAKGKKSKSKKSKKSATKPHLSVGKCTSKATPVGNHINVKTVCTIKKRSK